MNDTMNAPTNEAIAQEAVGAFIDSLITCLESHGIDGTNWDGDDPPAVIIANGIAGALNQATASRDRELAELKASAAVMRQALQRACIGSCECQAKTPDPQYHAETCRYKYHAKALATDAGKQLLAEVESLRAIFLKEHSATCVHHNDTERLNAGCPVCLRDRLAKAEGDCAKYHSVLTRVREDGCLCVHSAHWDETQLSGNGCPICIRQRPVAELVRNALEGQ